MTRNILRNLIGLFFCLLILSCNKTTKKKIIGNWNVNGRTVTQMDSLTDSDLNDINFQYKFKSNGLLITDFEVNSNWKIENDSVLIINTVNDRQEFIIKFKSDSVLIITEHVNNIVYTYQFDKILN